MIPVAEPSFDDRELEYVTDAVQSGWVSSQGKYIQAFEGKFAAYCGVKYATSVANGTVALHLALTSLGIGRGDEVIIPTLTFIAVANAVVYTGATPVLVDSELNSWCLDPKKAEEKISKRTKAIIAVHLYGHPANMGTIMDLAKKYHLFVIEDAAEAHGAECDGRKVGSIGDIGCFSFYGNKIITTGEGGMLTTNNLSLYEKAMLLKNHGMSRTDRYFHPEIGFNYRLTNVQAALGLAQLEKIDTFIKRKRYIVSLYSELLKNIRGLSISPELEGYKNVFWMFSVLINKEISVSRDKLMENMKKAGIETRPFFICVHRQPPHFTASAFPVAESLSSMGINLPSGPRLKDSDVQYISSNIREIINA